MKGVILTILCALSVSTYGQVKTTTAKTATAKKTSGDVVLKTTTTTTTTTSAVKNTAPVKKRPVKAIATLPKATANATKPTTATEVNVAGGEIHWITSIDELQAKMAQQPRKVIVDMYTEWCGWCKKMDAATYTNPALVKYVNNNFYAVKFDAERQDTIHFQGKDFYFFPQYKANGWAIELMKGSMSYPTTIFMTENFQNPTPIPGYRDTKEMEMFLTYFGDNAYRRQTFEAYTKQHTPNWDKGIRVDVSSPAGH